MCHSTQQRSAKKMFFPRVINKWNTEDFDRHLFLLQVGVGYRRMASLKDLIKCYDCSRTISRRPYECSHCLFSFCYSCLIEHHHTEVTKDLIELIGNIDVILSQFLHRAHSQTDWTTHLEDDRLRLEQYLRYIHLSPRYMSVTNVPTYSWLRHVDELIDKDEDAIFESCCAHINPTAACLLKKMTHK